MRPFKKIFVLLAIVSPLIHAQTLSEKIDAAIEQKLPYANIGVVVKDAETNQIIYSRNPTKLLSPASSMKLFTAAAALFKLKPDYVFSTTLSQKGKNYYLTFTGAPDFTTENLNELLANLKSAPGKMISGDIVLDISRFKPPYYAAGISYDDLGWYYTAPEMSLILNENAVAYDFISAKTLSEPIQIIPKSPNQFLSIINEVTTVSKEEEKKHCNLNIETRPENTLRIFGCFAKTNTPTTMRLAIPDPLLLAKRLIQNFLKNNHIVLNGQITTGFAPKDAKTLATVQSKNLTLLIKHMLLESDNLYADSLTRTLAFTLTGEGTNKQGSFALREILSAHTHLDMNQLDIADGIGTRYNLTTPAQLVLLLSEIYNNKALFKIFLQALPQSGLSGSLKERMKKSELNKLVFAKTGTMHDISSLSGYLLKPQAHPIIFSIIINGINTPIRNAKALEESILEMINSSTS